MKLFKNYKKLYNQELENRRLLIQHNSNLSKQRIDADIRSNKLAEEIAKLKIELEDLEQFYLQEKECSNALRKERTNLKREITILKKQLDK